MEQNNFEKTLINRLKAKLTDHKNDINIMNVIYNFLVYKNDESWNCRNVSVVGVGEIVQSNNIIIPEMLNTLGYFSQNYTVVIIKNNKTNKQNCLLFPPSKGEEELNKGVFATGHPVFEEINDGISDSTNWLIENCFNEQVEIYPVAFDNILPLTYFLNNNALKLNDVVCKSLKKGKVDRFSYLYKQIKK